LPAAQWFPNGKSITAEGVMLFGNLQPVLRA